MSTFLIVAVAVLVTAFISWQQFIRRPSFDNFWRGMDEEPAIENGTKSAELIVTDGMGFCTRVYYQKGDGWKAGFYTENNSVWSKIEDVKAWGYLDELPMPNL